MTPQLKQEAELLIQKLQLRATGANIHDMRSRSSIISGWLTFIRKWPEREEEFKPKLIIAMDKARQVLYK